VDKQRFMGSLGSLQGKKRAFGACFPLNCAKRHKLLVVFEAGNGAVWAWVSPPEGDSGESMRERLYYTA
jgi:hypothetical protein